MDPTRLLPLQMLGSLAAWSLVAFVVVRPWALTRPNERALAVVMLPLAFRHVGASVLSNQLIRPGLDAGFARHVAVGDTLACVLAVVAIVLLHGGWRGAIGVAWIANVVGLADLLLNSVDGARLGVARFVGAQWYVVGFGVPGMAVAHAIAFWLLLRRLRSGRGSPPSRTSPSDAAA